MLYIAIIAIIISSISCIISVKAYRKSRRTEFFQRRDQLFQKISELSTTNSEAHRISARYEMVAQNMVSLRLDGENAERIKNQIASIKRAQENLKLRTKHWDENIEALYSKCSSLTPKTDAAEIEKLIPLVQVASDSLKRDNERFLASLHILESTDPLLRADLDKLHKYEMQLAELNLQKAMNEYPH